MAGSSWRATLLALVLALLGCLLQPHGPHRPPPRWHVAAAAAEAPGDLNLTQLREESLEMFRFGFGQYMQRAFPRDDLRPISCRGKDSQGGIALTLIDSLDTLVVMGERDELRRAVAWLAANATFDVDARVHVFELTIRAVGGLLSAHMLIEQDPSLVPGYNGSLLRLAVDLTDRFMPAFDTPTGIPLSWVNLRRGQIPGDVRSTCTACAGTLLLEFGVLSRLTGNATYETKARHAVETIFDMRSPRGLVGNTLSCDSGEWERTDAGVGAGVDSFYEYLLKAYLAFGDERYLHMFKEVYAAAMINLQLDPAFHGTIWLVDVDMNKGTVLHPYVWSLGAFWPGLQALAGQVEEGVALHKNWSAAWKRFGWLPEMFDLSMDNRHPTETGYPLRPELMESTFLLHAATHNPRLLATGAALHARLRNANRVACGYASVGDVSTGHLEDTMESFFLSETVKYLYLLFSNASAVVDHFVLSTEGHLLPPFPDGPARGNQTAPGAAAGADEDASKQQQKQQQQQPPQQQQGTCSWEEAPPRRNPQQQGEQPSNATMLGNGSSSSISGNATSSDNVAKVVKATLEQQIEQHVEAKCRHLCSQSEAASTALSQATATLRAAMPLLPLPASAPALLRARRCTVCKEVTRTLRRAQLGKSFLAAMSGKSRVQAAAEAVRLSNRPAYSASGQLVNRQFLCVIEEVRGGGLGCGIFKEIPARQISQHRLNALPPNFMLIQLTDAPPKQRGQGSDAAAAGDMPSPGQEPITVSMQLADGSTQQFYGALADFGPLFEPGCSEPSSSSSSRGSTPSNGSSSAGGGTAGSNATSSNATSKDSGDASSRHGTAGAEAAPAHQQQSQALQPPQPLQWRGRELVVWQGGQPGREWRVVYVLGEEHPDGSRSRGEEEEEDPYEDPEDDEVAASSSSRGRAGQGLGVAVSDGGDEYADEEEEGLGGASFAATLGLPSMLLCSVEGPALAVQPLDACGKLANAAALNGSVAVVQRGNCMFVEKALALQAAGAVAMVVVNSEAGELMAMGTDAQGSQTAIPAVMLSGADGGVLLQHLMGGGGSGNSSSGKAGGSSGGINGSDGDNAIADSSRVRLRLYADALPGGPAGSEQQQCGVEAGASTAAADKSGPRRQQVELLMSQEAQLWLFKRVAETSSDPSAAFALILQQIQEHFLQQAFRKEP